MSRLLIVDDDHELAQLLGEYLSLEGFQIDIAADGIQGLEQLQKGHYDLMLLDVMMPGLGGFEVLKRLRAEGNRQPVLMLTAKGDEIDRVLGLEMGADDYLPKPFSERELLARIKAILRRTSDTSLPDEESGSLRYMDIELHPGQQQVLCQGNEVELTGTEFLLLQYLLGHAGELLSKAELSEQVLGKRLAPFDRSIDMHLSNLRKKLPQRSDGLPRVKTLRGRGYIWLQAE